MSEIMTSRLGSPLSRRQTLSRVCHGFGALALGVLSAESGGNVVQGSPLAVSGAKGYSGLHHPARAKHVIFLYMDGGPSQVDTYDPKPMLDKFDGKDPGELFKVEATQFNNNGKVLRSPWSFQQHGQSGIPVSELFPHTAKWVDSMAVVRSMVAVSPEHTSANYFLHTGHAIVGRPSMGAWVTYALGTETQELPGFVVLHGGLIPPGGVECFGSGFLPASHQGSLVRPRGAGLPNIQGRDQGDQQRAKLDLINRFDRRAALQRLGADRQVEAAIENWELAARMQMAVPDLMSLDHETAATRAMYGMDSDYEPTRIFGAECLLARRLVERGVRFIELTCPGVSGDRWDQHSDLKKGHENNARATDQPIAALLGDLKQRGLLDETLVIWAGEFGRTPFAQGRDGRDHNPMGFTVWMAGGGIRGGTVYGETDEWGYRVVRDKVEIFDLHATMLHLLGVDHLRSTFRFGGRDMRLTDVHGHVIHDIIT